MCQYCVLRLVAQSCLTFRDPMNCSLPGFSVLGILQARVLEWLAMPSSRGSSQPRDWTQVSCFKGRIFISWATREAQNVTDFVFMISVIPLFYIKENKLFKWIYASNQRRQWHSTPVLLPGESQGQRSLAGYSPWGHKELDTAEQLSLSLENIGTLGVLW